LRFLQGLKKYIGNKDYEKDTPSHNKLSGFSNGDICDTSLCKI
jgi:hypothetical protein